MKFPKKTIIAIFCLLFFSLNMQSQNAVIDSLKNELSLHQKRDSTRVNLLNELADLYRTKDSELAILYIKESESISDVIDFKKGKAKSLYIKGVSEAAQSNFDSAFQFLNEALEMYKTINYKPGISECYDSLGLLYTDRGERTEAISYYLKSVKINEALGNKEGISATYKSIGVAHVEIGNYEEALTYYDKALQMSKEINNEDRVSRCLINIGNVYLIKGNYPVAIEYHNKSLAINEKRKDTFLISLSLSNIGHIYRNLENYEKALTYSKKALAIQKKIGDKKRIAETLVNVGLIYIQLKEYEEAQNIFKRATTISEEIKNKLIIGMTVNNIGYTYLQLKDYNKALEYYEKGRKINLSIDGKRGLTTSYYGLARTYANQKKYKEALRYALKSKQLSQNLSIVGFEKDIHELLSTIYESTGQYKKALESHQHFKKLNDSLFNKDNIEKIAQLEYEYKYKQALDSSSIRELQLTKKVTATNLDLEKSQRNYLWAIIGVLLVSILLGSIIFYQKFKNIKTKNENIVMEQKLLRSQMTPHFIFNSLSVLQGMILNKDHKKSVAYLSKFSKLLRITLENSRDKTVLLSEEITALENYLALQNLENEAYHYEVNVDSTIDTTSFKIPPMLIQPFIENAVEHAFPDQKGNRKIVLHLKRNDEKLICTITDNGIGIDSQEAMKTKDKKSLATTITSERLEVLSRDLKMKGSVTVQDRKKYNARGTVVTLVVPYKTTS